MPCRHPAGAEATPNRMEHEGQPSAWIDEFAAIALNVASVNFSFGYDQLLIIECSLAQMRLVWGHYNHGLCHR